MEMMEIERWNGRVTYLVKYFGPGFIRSDDGREAWLLNRDLIEPVCEGARVRFRLAKHDP
jgi:hypothetical protein